MDYDASGKIAGLHGTVQDITERKRIEKELQKSIHQQNAILNNIPDIAWLKDTEGHFIAVNIPFTEACGVSPEDLVGKTDFDIWNKDLAERYVADDREVMKTGRQKQVEEPLIDKDGRKTWIETIKTPIYDDRGGVIGTTGIARDITERKKAQEQIEKSLKEKEVLLREVYHRVKNNMQIITSLLNLQSRYARDGEDREMFRESHNRIKSMALVHERLYRSKDLSTIDFKEYINDIAKGLFQSYGANRGKIAMVMDINQISLDINTAIPCGLIINELLTNSLKHAFPEGKEGEIKISVHSMNENTIELVVADNGIGISEDVDFRSTKSLGLQLVTLLAENQLHGAVNLDRSKGTEFTITFKEVK